LWWHERSAYRLKGPVDRRFLCECQRRIRNGTISITSDAGTHRFLFPDTDATLAGLNDLKAGTVDHLDCTQFANQ
jgi:hypothetical protein